MSEYFPWVEFMVLGGMFWWVFTIGMVCWLAWAAGDDSEVWFGGLLILAIYLIAMVVVGDATTWDLSLKTVGYWAAGYVPLGLAYMVLRWVVFILGEKRAFHELVSRFYDEHPALSKPSDKGVVDPDDKKTFSKWFQDQFGHVFNYIGRDQGYRHSGSYGHAINPVGWRYRHRLTTWAMWWPLSAFVWVLGDVVHKVWSVAVSYLTRGLTYISEMIWSDASDNFTEVPDEENKDGI